MIYIYIYILIFNFYLLFLLNIYYWNKYIKTKSLKEDIRQENVNLVISLYKGLKNQKIRRESNVYFTN